MKSRFIFRPFTAFFWKIREIVDKIRMHSVESAVSQGGDGHEKRRPGTARKKEDPEITSVIRILFMKVYSVFFLYQESDSYTPVPITTESPDT